MMLHCVYVCNICSAGMDLGHTMFFDVSVCRLTCSTVRPAIERPIPCIPYSIPFVKFCVFLLAWLTHTDNSNVAQI